MQAPVFEIKHNSLEDGPGIRSVVFFKGCPLNCAWCQNPEGKNSVSELWWEKETCISDGSCIEECPENAISFDFPHFIDRELCTNCFLCVDVCPSSSLKVSGSSMSVDEVISKIIPYKTYFETSGGGVTLSGGEATLYMKFISQLLQELKHAGIDTLLQTSGYFDLEAFEDFILPYTDIIYYDIKIMDPLQHKEWCGLDNEVILSNFTRLHARSLTQHFKLLPRTPLITNITDTEENISSIASFYKSLSITRTTLLPNNPLWLQKLGCLGISGDHIMNDEVGLIYPAGKQEVIRNQFNGFGIDVDFG